MDALADGTIHNIIDARCDENGKEFLGTYLDQIHDTAEFNRYIYFALKEFNGLKINPYEQAVISGCLDMMKMIDNKYNELSRPDEHSVINISMRPYLSHRNNCNSPLHLAIMFSRTFDKTKGVFILDPALVEYLSKDRDNVFLTNTDGCTAYDLVSDKQYGYQSEISNFSSIAHFLNVTRVERQKWASASTSNIYLENCLERQQYFADTNP